MLNRRNLFAAGAAVAVAAAPVVAVAETAASDAQLLHWEREAARLTAMASQALMSDERTDELCDQAAEFEALIAEAPCNTHTAMLVKMRTVVRDAVVGGSMYRIDHATMMDDIIGFLEGRR